MVLSGVGGKKDGCNVVGVGLGVSTETGVALGLGAEVRAVFVVGVEVGILVGELVGMVFGAEDGSRVIIVVQLGMSLDEIVGMTVGAKDGSRVGVKLVRGAARRACRSSSRFRGWIETGCRARSTARRRRRHATCWLMG
jgi:hypothetical protein